MFEAMDKHYDLSTGFGLWLEWRFEPCPHENEFVFCVDGLEDPVCIKEKLRMVLKLIIGSDKFVLREGGLLGPTVFVNLLFHLLVGRDVSWCVCFVMLCC